MKQMPMKQRFKQSFGRWLGIKNLVVLGSAIATLVVMRSMVNWDPTQLEALLERAGIWAPLAYVGLYIVATLLILPSTVLNLLGGAVFGLAWGLLWTTVAALVAAIVGFTLARTIGQRWALRLTRKRLNQDTARGAVQAVSQSPTQDGLSLDVSQNQSLARGGMVYIFAIRLLPLIPYGLVNFAAGLTTLRWRDYCVGTALGTVPGILPFVWLGSSGRQALQTGELVPLLGAMGSIGCLVLLARWYKHRSPQL